MLLAQDVVGEVETFNYPRFVLEGFQFLGVGDGSTSVGDGGRGFSEAMGEAVRMYTMQTRCCMTLWPLLCARVGRVSLG